MSDFDNLPEEMLGERIELPEQKIVDAERAEHQTNVDRDEWLDHAPVQPERTFGYDFRQALGWVATRLRL